MSRAPPERRSTRSSCSSPWPSSRARALRGLAVGGRRSARGRSRRRARRPGAPAPAPALATPLLSYRRTPGVLARDLSLDDFAARGRRVRGDAQRDVVRRREFDGVPVGATRADVPLIPASNQKLLVGAVALDVLGPDTASPPRSAPTRRRRTVSLATCTSWGRRPAAHQRRPIRSRTTSTRSPTRRRSTRSPTPWSRPGVQRVEGAVVGDGTRYDDEWYVPSWSADIRGIEAGPYDALLVNDARVDGRPAAGRRSGRGGGARVHPAARRAGVDGHRRRRARAAPTARRVIASVAIGAAADGRRGDARHERQQHRRAAGQGDRAGSVGRRHP